MSLPMSLKHFECGGGGGGGIALGAFVGATQCKKKKKRGARLVQSSRLAAS